MDSITRPFRFTSWSGFALALSALLQLGCGMVTAIPSNTNTDRTEYQPIQAYGRVWKHSGVLATKPMPYLDRVFASSSYQVSTQYLMNDKGESKAIEENIYSLRKNGQYDRYSFLGNGKRNWAYAKYSIFEMNDRIFICIEEKSKNVTNCAVHPPNETPSYFVDEQTQDTKPTIFFGELDPLKFVFHVNEFVPAYDPDELKQRSKQRPFDELKFYFNHRKSYQNLANE